MTVSLRRRASFLLLGAFLLLPWVAAAEPHGQINPGSLFTRLWNHLTAVWSQAGCSIDPFGGCVQAPADEGCSADPFGRCQPAPTTDEGCSIDPFGRCLPSPSTDEGCSIDPYGGCGS